MGRRTASLIALALAALPAPAAAAPDCPERSETRVLLEGQGTLESVIVDPRGPLFFTNERSVLRLERPGEQPTVLAEVEEPGGLAFDLAGNLIVGFGNTASNGARGDATGPSGLMRIDPVSGAKEVYATGLSMANGLVRGPDGSFYASNDFGRNIDRVVNGQTERGWAHVPSGNGLAIDTGGRWLYAAQTFQPAAIQQVDLSDPERVTPYVEAGPGDQQAGLDGMDRDAADQLFVTANGAGQVWRVAGSPPEICVVVRGLPGFPDGPSAVAVGRPGTPFPPTHLYVVAFDGRLHEIAGAAAAEPPPPGRRGAAGGPAAQAPLRVRVRPTVVVRRQRRRFSIVVERFADHGWQPVPGATVRFAGRRLRTRADGTLRFRHRFARAGRRHVRAFAAGVRSRAVTIVVRRTA
ncbi:MAG TPA: hypothetical protein VHF89_12705 [Solirubrobacteraceae bacterium]|nr:hypothetical protein [Solirubrobacteraceae bacterium]